MAEAPLMGDDASDQVEITGSDLKKSNPSGVLRPPNKKKYDEEMDSLSEQIKDLEAEYKSLKSPIDGSVYKELRDIRSQKDDMITKRKSINLQLNAINKEIAKQYNDMTKVESELRFKSEQRINETIQKLQYQLENVNFTLNDEKRIVSEIDALKRSRKSLAQYMLKKKQVDDLKEKAKNTRQEGDGYHKQVTMLKHREEKIKQKTQGDKLKASQTKKLLDELYERRRVRAAEYRTQMKEYQQYWDEYRRRRQEENIKKKEEQKVQDQEAYQKELAEYEATRVPYQAETQLVNTLLSYLHRFVMDPEASSEKTETNTPGAESSPADRGLEDGMFVLKKKQDEELFGGVVRPKHKKNRQKRRVSNKPIYHTPEIFDQFSTLKLVAPATTLEVPASISQLENKKVEFEDLAEAAFCEPSRQAQAEASKNAAVEKYLESLPPVGSLPPVTDCQDNSELSGTHCHPSIILETLSHEDLSICNKSDQDTGRVDAGSIGPESAICEDSIPSTPEVLLDRPKFPNATSPTLSHDSGAASLDNRLDDLDFKPLGSPTPSEQSTLIPDESPSPIDSRSDSLEDNRTDSIESEETSTVLVDPNLQKQDLPSEAQYLQLDRAVGVSLNKQLAQGECVENIEVPVLQNAL